MNTNLTLQFYINKTELWTINRNNNIFYLSTFKKGTLPRTFSYKNINDLKLKLIPHYNIIRQLCYEVENSTLIDTVRVNIGIEVYLVINKYKDLYYITKYERDRPDGTNNIRNLKDLEKLLSNYVDSNLLSTYIKKLS